MRTIFDSSGDLRADRRYAHGLVAAAEGDRAAAVDLLQQALEIAPDWAPAWFALGEARLGLGETAAASQAFGRAMALDPQDRLGASLHLQRLSAGCAQPSMPSAYVRELFNQYADRFDSHLGKTLAYRAPALVRAAIERARPAGQVKPFFARALDLGCGTGLAAQALAGTYGRLCGVDLSPRMIEKAVQTGLYDALIEADILAFLESDGAGCFDLAVACDVFVYFGDLERTLTAVARRLATGGLFAFSVQSPQSTAAKGYELGADLRFAHSRPYVEASAASAGLTMLFDETVVLRQDRGEAVHGVIFVLGKDNTLGAIAGSVERR
jgi:predicted TPR repeat methyltransferase